MLTPSIPICCSLVFPSWMQVIKCLLSGFPPSGVIALNVDGSHNSGGSACGRLLRNSLGQFLRGFHCNLGLATSVLAELWGLVLGLRLARCMGIASLRVELDSMVVVNMVVLWRSNCLLLRPLLDKALSLISSPDWAYLLGMSTERQIIVLIGMTTTRVVG